MGDSSRRWSLAVRTGMTIDFPTESTQILATPAETGDRYRVRVIAPAGGGPGIRGSGPHVHPGLTETFRCVSGTMTARVGREVRPVAVGETLDVTPGTVHGFVNSGDEPLVVEVDIVFTPPGPRPEADLIAFAVLLDRLVRDGRVSSRSGMPSTAQIAVLLEDRFPEAMTQPGLGGRLIRPLAALGRLRGLRSEFPEYGD